MKPVTRFLFIAILSAYSQNVGAQVNWSFKQQVEFNRYTLYQGMTGNTRQVPLFIKESYVESPNQRPLRKVFGWYKKNNLPTKIPLTGYVCQANTSENTLVLFVPKYPLAYSFDENCRLIDSNPKETFRHERKWDSSHFEWQTGDGQQYPATLKTVHQFSWTTKAMVVLSLKSVYIETFNLNQPAKNKYIENIEIVSEKRVNSKFHILIKYWHQSAPGSYG